jgi:uncharacterized protein
MIQRNAIAIVGRLLICLGLIAGAWAGPAGAADAKTRVLLVTGGHKFEQEPFLDIFRSYGDVTFEWREHPNAQEMFAPEKAALYDVVVLYDMCQKIDDATKANFLALLKAGKGLVVLHHAIANYNDWDTYAGIIGARYYLKPKTVGGIEKARSQWKHGVVFTVKIADPAHPVTRGLSDFEITDETYNLFDVLGGVKPLLTTTEPTSGPTIGWAKEYERSRIVFVQLGHDHVAYENPNYRKLVHQAILWTSGRE